MDLISNLPDEIICHMGSFLSAKEAAFTKVLSKRWRNLITIIQDLRFDESVSGGRSFKDFVDGVLSLPPTSRIRNFSIKRWYEQTDQYVNLKRCLCDVVKRGVLFLELRTEYSLPLEVFTCKTVEELTLGCGFVIDILPDNVCLPALKTLFLDSVRFCGFGRCAFTTLFSASPLLEELVIDGVEWERWKWSRTVSSPTLRRLTIRRQLWQPYADDSEDEIIRLDCRGLAYDFDNISFDLPGLIYLEYSDYVPKEYLIVNLNSLVEAKLTLCVDEYGVWETIHADDYDFNPMKLINALRNVEILDLNFETIEMFGVFPEAIPVFEKLSRITVRLHTYCWSPMVMLINNSPNLKTLIIEGSLHYGLGENKLVCECVSGYSFLLSCPLEVLEINDYDGSIEELEQMKHLLGKLSCLEEVKVRAQVPNDIEMQVQADLLKLPRASSECKLKVRFD